MSTQAFPFFVDDLTLLGARAGDDARRIVIADAAGLRRDELGIWDHVSFIRTAQSAAMARRPILRRIVLSWVGNGVRRLTKS